MDISSDPPPPSPFFSEEAEGRGLVEEDMDPRTNPDPPSFTFTTLEIRDHRRCSPLLLLLLLLPPPLTPPTEATGGREGTPSSSGRGGIVLYYAGVVAVFRIVLVGQM